VVSSIIPGSAASSCSCRISNILPNSSDQRLTRNPSYVSRAYPGLVSSAGVSQTPAQAGWQSPFQQALQRAWPCVRTRLGRIHWARTHKIAIFGNRWLMSALLLKLAKKQASQQVRFVPGADAIELCAQLGR
jgi:hypothetical protein